MAAFNQVTLLGNVTRDPEVRQTPSGTQVTSWGLAVNRRWNQNGERREEVSFFDLEAFGKTAEIVGQYVTKGDLLHIVGRLKQDRWETNEGQQRSRVKVIVEGVQMFGGKAHGDSSQSDPAQPEAGEEKPPF